MSPSDPLVDVFVDVTDDNIIDDIYLEFCTSDSDSDCIHVGIYRYDDSFVGTKNESHWRGTMQMYMGDYDCGTYKFSSFGAHDIVGVCSVKCDVFMI